jgi:hypothetical protein
MKAQFSVIGFAAILFTTAWTAPAPVNNDMEEVALVPAIEVTGSEGSVQVQINARVNSPVTINITESSGNLVFALKTNLQKGNNVITLDGLRNQPRGVYFAQVYADDQVFREKVLLVGK